MNAGVALALVALGLLALAWLTERALEPIDKKLVQDKLRGYDSLGMKEFFTAGELGETRLNTVLGATRLSAAARDTLAALITSLAGLVVTSALVAAADDEPTLRTVRLVAGVALVLLAGTATVTLFVRTATGDLRLPSTHARDRNGNRLSVPQRYWANLRRSGTLTRPMTVVVLANATTILMSVGL